MLGTGEIRSIAADDFALNVSVRAHTQDIARQALTRAGAMCPRAMLLKLNSAFNYLWVGHWMRSRDLRVPRPLAGREQIFRVAAEAVGDRQVLYLEFGVYRGASLRLWSALLRNPDSRLHAFDSFEGLPETWDLDTEKGRFSTFGATPEIDDPRVTFFKGWFADTLPRYVPPSHQQLVVALDADLYSSTKTVLDFLKPHVRVGTYLYFDEFQSREHELRAFDEFLQETGLQFRVIAADRGLCHVLFECVGLARTAIRDEPPDDGKTAA